MPRKVSEPVVERLPGLSQAHAKSSEPTPTPVVTAVLRPKREISEAQREHLNKIRELAMKKKAELKEITLKSKLAKTVPKQELAKQYDEYVTQKAVHNLSVKPQPRTDPEPEESDEEETVIIKKPKKKIKKKIIFESESDEEQL